MPTTRLNLDLVVQQTFVASLEHLPSLASTNDRAARRAVEGTALLPLLILADEQTAGRGRGANRWWTGPGSLAFSLLLAPEQAGVRASRPPSATIAGTQAAVPAATPGRSPLVALAAAVSVIETVAQHVPSHVFGIHWPNDVMAAGRKLAGILVEVLPDGRHIVGIGVNTNNSAADAPEDLREGIATLRDLAGRPFDQTAILVAMLQGLERHFGSLASASDAIAARADALCLQREQVLTIELAGQRITGRCLGIARDGGLLLQTPGGPRVIYSGVVCKS
jgi:BirA family transcriptional regulator, biotin operon repressor / biotin---[acetyl-CoA-carboxylase] ligase